MIKVTSRIVKEDKDKEDGSDTDSKNASVGRKRLHQGKPMMDNLK